MKNYLLKMYNTPKAWGYLDVFLCSVMRYVQIYVLITAQT